MIQLILEAIILIITGLIYLKFIPYLKKNDVYDEVCIAVKAAQQIFGLEKNTEKFQYVFDTISKKFDIASEELTTMIESAVYEIKQKVQ